MSQYSADTALALLLAPGSPPGPHGGRPSCQSRAFGLNLLKNKRSAGDFLMGDGGEWGCLSQLGG